VWLMGGGSDGDQQRRQRRSLHLRCLARALIDSTADIASSWSAQWHLQRPVGLSSAVPQRYWQWKVEAEGRRDHALHGDGGGGGSGEAGCLHIAQHSIRPALTPLRCWRGVDGVDGEVSRKCVP